MNRLKNIIESYKSLIKDLEIFKKNVERIVELNLSIWIEIAKMNDLKLNEVLIEESFKLTFAFEEFKIKSVEIPDVGKVNITKNKGTVIFTDISKSTEFLKNENYAGFVIFNSYISLIKTYTRLSGGEFLEYTGDGSMIFYEKDILNTYNECRFNMFLTFKEKVLNILDTDKSRSRDFIVDEPKKNFDFYNLTNHPLCMIFYLGYLLQIKLKNNQLLYFDDSEEEIYSLVHIGASYGDVLDVNLGDMRKIISDTVWEAANNCKDAPRSFKIDYERKLFVKLPIKI